FFHRLRPRVKPSGGRAKVPNRLYLRALRWYSWPVCPPRAAPRTFPVTGRRPMPQERSDAVVLLAVDFSETSRIVSVLTPQRGKMALLATGVRRPKSELAALLDTFNRVELVYYWKDSRSVQRLGEASLLSAYAAVKRDLDKQAYAGVGLEFVYKVAHENEP